MNTVIQNILEVWGLARFEYFSSVMEDESLYTTPFILMILIPLAALLIYYKIADSITGANIGRWLIYGISSSAIAALVSFLLINSKNDRLVLDFLFADIFGFVVVIFVYALLIFIGLSFAFRYISTHRRYVPV